MVFMIFVIFWSGFIDRKKYIRKKIVLWSWRLFWVVGNPLVFFFKGWGGVVERCFIWIVGQSPSFLIRKLRDKLCGKLAVRDLMHYRWVPYTSSLASPEDERDWSVNCNLWHNGVVKSMNSFCVCMSNLSMLN